MQQLNAMQIYLNAMSHCRNAIHQCLKAMPQLLHASMQYLNVSMQFLNASSPHLGSGEFPLRVCLTGDELIGVGHHSDEHVEEDDEADGGVSAEHRHAQEFRVVMILFQAEVVQVDQAVNRPKQRLMSDGKGS